MFVQFSWLGLIFVLASIIGVAAYLAYDAYKWRKRHKKEAAKPGPVPQATSDDNSISSKAIHYGVYGCFAAFILLILSLIYAFGYSVAVGIGGAHRQIQLNVTNTKALGALGTKADGSPIYATTCEGSYLIKVADEPEPRGLFISSYYPDSDQIVYDSEPKLLYINQDLICPDDVSFLWICNDANEGSYLEAHIPTGSLDTCLIETLLYTPTP